MEILEPKAEYWEEKDSISHVARCARVCYKSKGKDRESDIKLCEWLEKHDHMSMFRHSSHYFKIPKSYINENPWLKQDLESWFSGGNPYIAIADIDTDTVYVSTNGQFVKEWSSFSEDYNLTKIWRYAISAEEMKAVHPELVRYTFWLQTQISTSRELNRVSPNNIAEQSTRYVTEKGSIVRPHWLPQTAYDEWLFKEVYDDDEDLRYTFYFAGINTAFEMYEALIKNGLPKEDARGTLPLDTTTHVVYTYTRAEWDAILRMRLYESTGKAHPNCKVICKLIEDELIKNKAYKDEEVNEQPTKN